MRRRWVSAAGLAITTAAIATFYFTVDRVPNQLPPITPFIAVLVVLLFATRRLRMPAADGRIWIKS